VNIKQERREQALMYLAERTGKLEYRFIRYAAVADELYAMGLTDQHIICDVGAGMGDFDFYMRTVRGYKGRYVPVDAAIDGTDLVGWEPPVTFDFITAIEVLEHLHKEAAQSLLVRMLVRMRYGLVITTPNTDVLGYQTVVHMDRTHVNPIYQQDLFRMGAVVKEQSFFGQPNDSLLATWRAQ